MKKVLVVHPGKQHSLRTAGAILESGQLYKYITTIYDKKGSITHCIKKCFGEKNKKKMNTRKSTEIPDEYVLQYCELRAMFGILLSKVFGLSSVVWHKYNYYLNDVFGKKVAKYAIKHNVDLIVSYDNNSSLLFETVKKYAPGIQLVLDVSIANRLYMKNNYIKDIESFGDIKLKDEQRILWDEDVCLRIKKEMELADHFIVASTMSRDSLIYSGVRKEKISIIPYGVDLDKFEYVKKKDASVPLKMVYVGQISRRKGLHHLLKYTRDNAGIVSLKLAGDLNTEYDLYKEYSKDSNVEFLGFVTPDKLAEVYKESDVFVFPTLGEGFGLVVLEALSCGVPVICSDLAGGNDAITDGVNGFVFKGGSDIDMDQKIQKIINHEVSLPELSENARQSVEYYTWKRYRSAVIECITTLMENSKGKKYEGISCS